MYDGAGYAEVPNDFGKRPGRTLDGPLPKRPARHNSNNAWQPQVHVAFQPGSTPWKGNRRYLCLNLTGFVWTVDQETHHTVTVEFYDRYLHRDFHFTDPYKYDKACLNDKGTLFSCESSSQHPAILYYRPHETWTARTDWRTELPAGEEVTSMSLSDSCIVATTSTGYVRIYSLFGVPLKMYRQKSTPAVTCASWRDYVMTIGNGPIGGDGITRLLYTIENVKRDEICQSEDILALPPGAGLKSVFFSDKGDPCIYDSEEYFSFACTGEHQAKDNGFPYSTPNPWSVLRVARKKKLTGRSPLPMISSIVSFSKAAKTHPTSHGHCCPISTSAYPSPRIPPWTTTRRTLM